MTTDGASKFSAVLRMVASVALSLVLCLAAPAQQMTRILERGPVGFLQGHTLLQRTGDLTAGDFAHPAVADWDDNGSDDLVCGSGYGDLLLFTRRVGEPFPPGTPLLPSDEVGLTVTPRRTQVSPWLGRLQAGGDLSLLLGMGDRIYRYAVRDGSTADGTLIAGPGTAAELPGPLAPTAADIDGDGVVDVLAVDGEGRVHRLTDVGPEPVEVADAQLQVAPPARAWSGHWDGDGKTDLVIGTGEGRVLLVRGQGQNRFAEPLELLSETAATGLEAAPWATDWDGDGDMDLLVGWRNGTVTLLRSDGATVAVTGALQQRDAPIDAGRCPVASAGDWNGDGLPDVVIGGEDGYVRLCARLPGEPMRFERALRIAGTDGPIRAPGSGHLRYAAPALTDWDADGDLDLLVGGASGHILLWQNSAGLHPMGRLQVSGTDLRMIGIAMPAPYDYNGDGDVDLFVGARLQPERDTVPGLMIPAIPPGCAYFENTVDRTGALPVFAKGVPVAMTLVSKDTGLRRDAGFMRPYAMYPVHWDRALDFLTVTLNGTVLFTNTSRRGAYACLAADCEGRELPGMLLPPVYSATPGRLDGKQGVLAAGVSYGFVTWYTQDELAR